LTRLTEEVMSMSGPFSEYFKKNVSFNEKYVCVYYLHKYDRLTAKT